MDREMIERHLALAESHVQEGQRHIEDQQRILAELERDGHDTTEARRLLSVLEQTQRLHVEDRARLSSELAQLDRARE
jgi:hypothetical protein